MNLNLTSVLRTPSELREGDIIGVGEHCFAITRIVHLPTAAIVFGVDEGDNELRHLVRGLVEVHAEDFDEALVHYGRNL